MIVTIHQPEHLPYFGLLDKINKSDTFVVLDDVDYKKHNFQNRNRILTPYGPKWLTIPVSRVKKRINEQCTASNWKQVYQNKVIECYRKYPHFNEGITLIEEMLDQKSDLLIDYNMWYLKKIVEVLNIETKIVVSSELNILTTRTQKLYDICKTLGATQYLAGGDASSYMDFELFKDIEIREYKLEHVLTSPYMSSLDFVMNIGIGNFKTMIHQ
jgi:hypothetical protein